MNPPINEVLLVSTVNRINPPAGAQTRGLALSQQLQADGYLVTQNPRNAQEEEMLIGAGYMPYDIGTGDVALVAVNCVWARKDDDMEMAA